ncbi:MAG TPA: S8 family serine peptidase, partial [Vicinamibacteria bacterium]
ALARLGAREIYRVRRVLNGIAVLAEPRQAAAMRGLPGVKRVRPIEPEVPHNRTSVPFIGAPQVWTATAEVPTGLRGRGLKIGIIDTGIDYMHGTFGGTGVLADYQQAATDTGAWTANPRGGPGRFPTAKIAGGWDFAGDDYSAGVPAQATPLPDANPMDCHGHGTHVAGTAAGYGVTAAGATYTGAYNATDPYAVAPRIGPGVAPEATLYALRVFGCGGSTALTAQAIDWAIDPDGDGDFSDRLDVINMSLGSSYGNPSDLTADASDAAARAGVVVVASAGNSGDTYFVSGSPGAAGRAIAVANVTDGGSGAYVQVSAPAGIAGPYVAGTAAFGPPVVDVSVSGNLVLVDDGSGTLTDGCQAPFANAAAVAGNIALIDRGTCSFKTKTVNAEAAGAIGVVIANNAAGDPPGLGDDASILTPVTIPTVSVTQATGASFKTALAGDTVTLSFQPGGDSINSSSSRGPRNAVPIRLKPDVAAPGTSIPSAQSGRVCTGAGLSTGCIVSNGTGYIPDNAVLTISGTSMAAPHVAGLMALLREAHPGWTVEQLKALVMNRSVHDVFQYAGGIGQPIGAGRVGAGRVDAPLAADGLLLAMNADEPGLVSVSFDGEVSGTVTRRRRVRLENHGDGAVQVALGLQPSVTAPGVSFSLSTSTLNVPAGGFATFEVVMDADATQMDLAPDPSVAAIQGTRARHRLAEAAAYVTFVPGMPSAILHNGGPQMRLPLYAALKPVSATAAAGPLQTGGAATGTGSITLEGVGVCTGALAGSSCSGSFPTDRASLVSAFELSGMSPKAPDLYGSGFEAGDLKAAGVQYDSLNGLLVFGLATWDTWASPAQVAFNVIVDGNADGTDDRLLFNPRFTSSSLPTDWHLGGTAAYPSGSGVASNFFVNLVSPGTGGIDTGLFGSNVLMLGAFPAQVGVTVGQAFRWRVVSCPGFDPFCGLPGGSPLDSMGPYTWSTAAQGLSFDGAWGLDDQGGSEVPVTWNTANLATNGSVGALLLHHLGAEGRRSEVVLVQTSATTPPSTVDLAVTLGVGSPLAAYQSEVAISATAANAGPEDAADVAVHVPIPAGLTHVSHSGTGVYDPVSGVWTVGDLPAGAAPASLEVVVRAGVPGVFRLLAEVSTSTPIDVAEADNRATASFTVLPEGYSAPGGFYTVTPCRVVDTRNTPSGTWAGPSLAAQTERVFPIVGQCGVPPTAKAIAVNVTATASTGVGSLKLYAAFPPTAPNTSVLNFGAGVTRANNAIVGLNAAGQMAVFNSMATGTTDFVLDVVGYFE